MIRRIVVLAAVIALVGGGCGRSSATHPDLLLVSSRSGVYAIYGINVDRGGDHQLSNGAPTASGSPSDLFFQVDPAWSPDASMVAFASSRTGTTQLYVMHADGTSPRRLTSARKDASRPSWSPDGSRIVFVENDPGDLYVMRANGTGAHRLGKDLAKESDPAWSPDGKLIAFVRRTPGTSIKELWAMRPDGSGRQQITHLKASVSSPSWSPDDRRLAFAANVRGQFEISVVGLDGKGLRRLTNSPGDDIEPAWSPDGKLIAFSRDGSIDIVDLTGKVRRLTDGENNDSSPAWKPLASDASLGK